MTTRSVIFDITHHTAALRQGAARQARQLEWLSRAAQRRRDAYETIRLQGWADRYRTEADQQERRPQ